MNFAHSTTSTRTRLGLAVLCASLFLSSTSWAILPSTIYLLGWRVNGQSIDGRYLSPNLNGGIYPPEISSYLTANSYPGPAYWREGNTGQFIFWDGISWAFTGDQGETPFEGGSPTELWQSVQTSPSLIPGTIYDQAPPEWGVGLDLDELRLSWGFSLGLGVWAMVLGGGAVIRWIREIGDAAT